MPSLGPSIDVSFHERIVKAIRDAGGVAFCRSTSEYPSLLTVVLRFPQ